MMIEMIGRDREDVQQVVGFSLFLVVRQANVE